MLKRRHAALAAPEVRDVLIKQGNDVTPTTPEEAAKILAADLAKYAAIVKKAGVKLE